MSQAQVITSSLNYDNVGEATRANHFSASNPSRRYSGCLDVDGMGASSPATITLTIDDCLDDDGGADRNAEPNTEREAREEDGDVGGWKVNGMGAS